MLVINIGMPRSGTLWRYKITRDLVIAGGGEDGLEIRKKYFLYPFISGINADINTLKAKRLLPAAIPSLLGRTYTLNTHDMLTPTAKSLIQRGRLKAIYGYRDPRDCLLSMLEYSERDKPQYSSQFLELNTVQEAADYMEFYIDAWKLWTSQSGVLVLRYEDLLSNFESLINQIIVYLDLIISPEDKERIIRQYLPKQKSTASVATHFEHGIAHRFRSEFNQGEMEYLAERYAPILSKMGYTV
jgi:hypothetical protein